MEALNIPWLRIKKGRWVCPFEGLFLKKSFLYLKISLNTSPSSSMLTLLSAGFTVSLLPFSLACRSSSFEYLNVLLGKWNQERSTKSSALFAFLQADAVKKILSRILFDFRWKRYQGLTLFEWRKIAMVVPYGYTPDYFLKFRQILQKII